MEKKSVKDLHAEVAKVVEEIAKMRLEMAANPPKDTNILFKKRKQLARLKTAASLKKNEV